MINKLTADRINYMNRVIGYYDTDRMSGRSTALALKFISQAILIPNTPIKVYDHLPNQLKKDTDRMIKTCLQLAQKLELKYFSGNKQSGTIICEIFEK